MNKLRRVLDIATCHDTVAGAFEPALVARLDQHCRTQKPCGAALSYDLGDATVEVAHA